MAGTWFVEIDHLAKADCKFAIMLGVKEINRKIMDTRNLCGSIRMSKSTFTEKVSKYFTNKSKNYKIIHAHELECFPVLT